MTEYGVAPLNIGLTQAMCACYARTGYEDLPEGVRHQAKRAVLDWVGCALAGARHPTLDKLLAALSVADQSTSATVIGRERRLGLLSAAIANGQMGHVLDFDDTHMDGVVLHASSPLLSALFALSETRRLSGRDLALAFAVGVDAAVRVGKAARRHHDGGWHLTGTLGSIGAAAACGRAVDLDASRLAHACGVGATQAAGMQQNRGTDCKSLHAGRAGANGLLAALLAEQGFDSSPEIFEGRKGFCRIYSAETDLDALTDGLGSRWELQRNGYKPYACGVVQHPLIDATIALAGAAGASAESVERIDAEVNEAAVRITGVEDPETGLKSKFSLRHSAAVGFLDGAAGVAQYTDQRAAADDVRAMRARIHIQTADDLARDQARAVLTLTNGETHRVEIEHAGGTAANPLSDAQLESKFTANAEPLLGRERTAQVRESIWRLDLLEDVAELVSLLSAPEAA